MLRSRNRFAEARPARILGDSGLGRLVSAGFSMVEMMIVIAVLGILLAIAAPNITDYTRELRLSSAIGPLVADISLARAEAIKRNNIVIICAKSAATDTCSGSTNWATGWLICYDADDDGACDATSATDPNPIRVGNPLSQMTLTGTAALVRFNGNGNSNANTTLTLQGTWTASTTRIGAVEPSGRVRGYKP